MPDSTAGRGPRRTVRRRVIGAPSQCATALRVVVLGGKVRSGGLIHDGIGRHRREHDPMGQLEEVGSVAEYARMAGNSTKSVRIAVGHLPLYEAHEHKGRDHESWQG